MTVLLTIGLVGFASAHETVVINNEEGIGTPAATGKLGTESAKVWDSTREIYHVPQYMPGYPTAAVIFPRVVDVECKQNGSTLLCKGYHLLPEDGRGEYLMIHPVVREEPKPSVVVVEKTVPVTVIKEVEVKRKKE